LPDFSWPSKIYPNWDFWFENKPSGNPGSDDSTFYATVCSLDFRFIVSREKCFHIYKFFQDNFPNKYGPIDTHDIERTGMELIRVRAWFIFFYFVHNKLTPNSLAGFDHATHNTAGRDDTARPYRQGD
jgi:hypothetical protein